MINSNPIKNVVLSSSNLNKINEFKRIIPNIQIVQGKDIKEIYGNMDDVIIYKSLDMGKNFIVEDTILKIDGKEVVDIRWNQEDKLKNTKKCEWIVSLGYNDGTNIYIFRGIVNGIIVKPNINGGFGFDPYFLPDGCDITLAELENEGNKDKFSARVKALKKFIKFKPDKIIRIDQIKPWKGKYQNQ